MNGKECQHKWILNPYRQNGRVVKDCLLCGLSNIYVCSTEDYAIIEKCFQDNVYKNFESDIKQEFISKIKKSLDWILKDKNV
jgi:hypothetical protein